MQWTTLDISRAAVLKKEVDFGIRSLEEASNNGQNR